MAEKVKKVGVKRQDGFLYYVDKKGNVAKAKMARGGKKGGSPVVIAKTGIQRKKGYLYFIDKQGDISCAKMVRGGKKKKKKKKKR